MRKVIPAFVALAAMAVGVALVAPQQSQASVTIRQPIPMAAPRAAPPCSLPSPSTPDQFNTMLGNVDGWKAGDGGHTTTLPDGRRVWSFGDSLLSDGRLHHNALVIQDRGCARSVQSTTEVLPNSWCGDDPSTEVIEGYCWGGPVAYANGRLFILAPAMASVPNCEGAFCFQGFGARLFTFLIAANGMPMLSTAVHIPIGADGIVWASALTVVGSQVYVYGYRDDGDPWTFGFHTYVSVAPLATLTQFNTWSAPKLILEAAQGPETSVSVTCYPTGVWSLVSTEDGGIGHAVTEWYGNSAGGPWTKRQIGDFVDTPDHLFYLPFLVAGTSIHVISQNWPHRPLSDIAAKPEDFRVIVW